MSEYSRKVPFWILGALFVLVGLVGRFNPRIVLPTSMGWSGDFAYSDYGLRLRAFEDIMNIVVLAGAALLILSFTSITDVDEK